jgi:hypothetical protein
MPLNTAPLTSARAPQRLAARLARRRLVRSASMTAKMIVMQMAPT